jgi:hypothetical protein
MNREAGIAAAGWVERSDTHLVESHNTGVPGRVAE